MTYEEALKQGRKVGAAHVDDQTLMAMLCDSTIRILCGAVSPKLVWEGARKADLGSQDLMRLAQSNPRGVEELMWL